MYKTMLLNYFFQLNFFAMSRQEITEQSQNGTDPTLIMENWTSCEEFLVNTTFDRNKLIDIDWQIFYFWNFEQENSYHIKFSVPYRLLTDRFKVELDKEITPPVNWTEAVLFMQTSIDFSALFFHTEIPGIFRLIPSLAFEAENVPWLSFGIKYVEPGYLGIMNCKYRMCYALAPVDKMPKPENIKLEAEKLGFYNGYGRSYLEKTETQTVSPSYSADDDGEDMDFEEHGFQRNYIKPGYDDYD